MTRTERLSQKVKLAGKHRYGDNGDPFIRLSVETATKILAIVEAAELAEGHIQEMVSDGRMPGTDAISVGFVALGSAVHDWRTP